MLRLKNKGRNHKINMLSFAALGFISLGAVAFGVIGVRPPATSAHEVQISNEVGGTLHVEPNDNPKAGSASLTWFALTRRGGQPIALSECSCSLAVYARPRSQNDSPIQRPTLSATSAEGRQGMPSANITFPRAGAYELVLQGRPVQSGGFTPFELKFSVTVAQ
jgi:hypothetical protein